MRAGELANSLLASAARAKLVPAHTLEKYWCDQLLYFARLLDRVRGIEGDVVECGVASGHSVAMLAAVVRSGEVERAVLGYDSWGGLPAPHRADLGSPHAAARSGLFQWSSEEQAWATLGLYGFERGEARITLVKGLFRETLQHHPQRPIAFLHLDVDLYESYLECLRALWPKMAPGGIVAFDEYELTRAWPGARRAVDEFLDGLPEGSASLERDERIGKYFAVKSG